MNPPHANDNDDEANTVIPLNRDVMDLGHIDANAAKALRIPEGPIRLYVGRAGKTGWGHEHVLSTPGREKDIQRLGYAGAKDFAFKVSAGWTQIHKGSKPVALGRITIVMPSNGYDLGLSLQWNGRAWGIVTMLPFARMSYELLYKK